MKQVGLKESKVLKVTKEFFTGWTVFEKIWILVFTIANIALTIVWNDNLLGTVATFTGMMANVLVAKGRISTYAFGIVNAITYGTVAYGYGLYGESMLNLGFYLITNILGFFLWKKHQKEKEEKINGEDIKTRNLTIKGWIILLVSILIGAFAYAEVLIHLESQQVRLDSFAVVLSIAGQILLLFRFTEQWILWIVVNTLSIILWVVTLVKTGGSDYAMITMWTAYLINSIYGYVNWRRISKNNKGGE